MARAASDSRPCVRDRILSAASELFYREGIHSVGIDRIIAESGVAKMSLYNHFKSKDALIAAWLDQQHNGWREWFQDAIARHAAASGESPLLAIFDALSEWFEKPNFRGCAFINSAVELVHPEHPGYQVSLDHQRAIADHILHLVQAAALPHPEALAQQLLILVQGATVVAMMHGCPNTAHQAKAAAAVLISAASPALAAGYPTE
jgi:AcrR family transcriptional regulator